MIEIEIDSEKSIVSESLYKGKFSNLPLKQSPLTSMTYRKEEIKPLRYVDVKVQYRGQSSKLIWTWMVESHPTQLATPININQVLQRHDSLFNGQLGKLNRIEAKLNLKVKAKAVFSKARSVPFTKKSKVGEKLKLL